MATLIQLYPVPTADDEEYACSTAHCDIVMCLLRRDLLARGVIVLAPDCFLYQQKVEQMETVLATSCYQAVPSKLEAALKRTCHKLLQEKLHRDMKSKMRAPTLSGLQTHLQSTLLDHHFEGEQPASSHALVASLLQDDNQCLASVEVSLESSEACFGAVLTSAGQDVTEAVDGLVSKLLAQRNKWIQPRRGVSSPRQLFEGKQDKLFLGPWLMALTGDCGCASVASLPFQLDRGSLPFLFDRGPELLRAFRTWLQQQVTQVFSTENAGLLQALRQPSSGDQQLAQFPYLRRSFYWDVSVPGKPHLVDPASKLGVEPIDVLFDHTSWLADFSQWKANVMRLAPDFSPQAYLARWDAIFLREALGKWDLFSGYATTNGYYLNHGVFNFKRPTTHTEPSMLATWHVLCPSFAKANGPALYASFPTTDLHATSHRLAKKQKWPADTLRQVHEAAAKSASKQAAANQTEEEEDDDDDQDEDEVDSQDGGADKDNDHLFRDTEEDVQETGENLTSFTEGATLQREGRRSSWAEARDVLADSPSVPRLVGVDIGQVVSIAAYYQYEALDGSIQGRDFKQRPGEYSRLNRDTQDALQACRKRCAFRMEGADFHHPANNQVKAFLTWLLYSLPRRKRAQFEHNRRKEKLVNKTCDDLDEFVGLSQKTKPTRAHRHQRATEVESFRCSAQTVLCAIGDSKITSVAHRHAPFGDRLLEAWISRCRQRKLPILFLAVNEFHTSQRCPRTSCNSASKTNRSIMERSR